tara:strand:+ start:172 stop:456 length:285 start_codon:yes stop_codon:yes gene_type:complete
MSIEIRKNIPENLNIRIRMNKILIFLSLVLFSCNTNKHCVNHTQKVVIVTETEVGPIHHHWEWEDENFCVYIPSKTFVFTDTLLLEIIKQNKDE